MTGQSTHKSIPIYFVGSLLRQLVGFLMLPIYTSLLTPADYGVIALLVMTVSVFESLMGARFGQALPKFYYESEDPVDRKSVISTALLLTTVVSTFTAAVVWVNSEALSSVVFGDVVYAQYLGLYSVLLVTSGIEAYGLSYLRIRNMAITFVSVSAAKMVVQLGLNIWFVVYLEQGIAGVVNSAVISSSMFAAASAVYVLYKVGSRFDTAMSKKLFIFTWPLWVAGIAGLYSTVANRFFIRHYADLSDVGLFELAYKFAAITSLFVWTPFSSWWQPERFRIYHEDDQGRSKYPVVFNAIITLLLVIGLCISVLAEPVIRLMSDEAFWLAADIIVLLVVYRVVTNLQLFFYTAFMVREKTIVITWIRYALAVLVTIGFVLVIPEHGFFGAAWVLAIVSIGMFVFVYHYSKRYLDMGVSMRYPLKISALLISAAAIDHLYLDSDSVFELLAIKMTLLAVTGVLVWVLVITDREAKELPARAMSMFRRKA